LVAVLAIWWRPARAHAPSVPLQLQVELCAKIMDYVREPPLSNLDRIRIGIVVRTDSPESMRAGTELRAAFDRVTTLAGHPHDQSVLEWPGALALAALARRQNLTVLYFTPGLDAEMGPGAEALAGQRIVTIAATDALVPKGAILGFELVSGHPRMILNLRQAKKQEVVLRAAVMKLMRIVE
jgi:hypothetical protein